jgi:hypothetical protein
MLSVTLQSRFVAFVSLMFLLASGLYFAVPAKAVTNLAISPTLECVINRDGVTYSAVFGYFNRNDETINIPVGNNNRFTPAPIDRGQTVGFLPGRQYAIYTVDFPAGTNLVWSLRSPNGSNRTATASQNSSPCSASVVAKFPWGI